jgi:hypothetical protein
MRRIIAVLGLVLVLTAAGIAPVAADPPSPANAAGAPGRILGIVPVLEQGKAGRPGGGSSNLIYHLSLGGYVMPSNQVYAIFWSSGTYAFEPRYTDVIKQYFTDVAHDSSTGSNVYATDTQYTGPTGTNIAYDSVYGGGWNDTVNPYVNDCSDKATTICLSDAQIQTEVQRAITANGWTATPDSTGRQSLFLVFTPQHVGSCFSSSCSYTNWCAYHSYTGSGSSAILYANQPYAAQNYRIYTCNSGQSPNSSTADATLNLVSHEHNEAITDEQGSAWYDSQGAENGDKCAWNFGSTLTAPNGAKYNQRINGNYYYLQQEWSNTNFGCKLTYP